MDVPNQPEPSVRVLKVGARGSKVVVRVLVGQLMNPSVALEELQHRRLIVVAAVVADAIGPTNVVQQGCSKPAERRVRAVSFDGLCPDARQQSPFDIRVLESPVRLRCRLGPFRGAFLKPPAPQVVAD